MIVKPRRRATGRENLTSWC